MIAQKRRLSACVVGLIVMSLLLVVVAADEGKPVLVDTSMAAMQKLDWKQRAPGVWSATIGKPEIGTMEFAGTPMLDALKELGEPALPPSMREARGDVHGGYASVRFPLGMEERVYGLGMRADGDVDLRQKTYHMRELSFVSQYVRRL